ncbi:hypothetical protein DPMN_167876 [Dreissena polymorpha]|uniref:Uncharacterized protein n=1 Tax=Dreissena polymorpha TaxID=45954 RepID=A0A9D4F4K9_DREPO|nr:hypothetical protein DPMN_167876 [Dreissena polymorpha]
MQYRVLRRARQAASCTSPTTPSTSSSLWQRMDQSLPPSWILNYNRQWVYMLHLQMVVCRYASKTILQLDNKGNRKLATLDTERNGIQCANVCYISNTTSIIVEEMILSFSHFMCNNK